MKNQTPTESFPVPVVIAGLAAMCAPIVLYTLGGAAFFLYAVALPIPLFVFWLSWGVAEHDLTFAPVSVRHQTKRAHAAV